MMEKWRDERGVLNIHEIGNSIRRLFTNIGALTLLGGVYRLAENLYFSWTLHFFWRLVVALFFLCSAFAVYATASRLDDAQQYIELLKQIEDEHRAERPRT
jgi:hypothetical protein